MSAGQGHVVVTGAAGFIGSHLAEALVGYRAEVSIEDGLADQAAWVAATLNHHLLQRGGSGGSDAVSFPR